LIAKTTLSNLPNLYILQDQGMSAKDLLALVRAKVNNQFIFLCSRATADFGAKTLKLTFSLHRLTLKTRRCTLE
jgi:hypothetical protein